MTITVSTGLGTVLVPDVAGQPEKRALKTLRDAGLRPKERQRSSGTVKRGLAIATVPEAGTELERGKPITLLVSTGPKLVQVPPVIGSQQDAADTAIRDAGLIPDFENRDSDAPVGEVIAQNPAGGQHGEAAHDRHGGRLERRRHGGGAERGRGVEGPGEG